MFNEYVISHTPPMEPIVSKLYQQSDKNTVSAEKMTQTNEIGVWQVIFRNNRSPDLSTFSQLSRYR